MKRPRLSKLKRLLIGSYGANCVWCGVQLDEDNSTADHVRCQSENGSHWLGNLLPSCYDCNHKRGQTPAEDWLRRCLQAGLPVRENAIRRAITRAHTDPRSDRDYFHTHGRFLKEGAN